MCSIITLLLNIDRFNDYCNKLHYQRTSALQYQTLYLPFRAEMTSDGIHIEIKDPFLDGICETILIELRIAPSFKLYAANNDAPIPFDPERWSAPSVVAFTTRFTPSYWKPSCCFIVHVVSICCWSISVILKDMFDVCRSTHHFNVNEGLLIKMSITLKSVSVT